MRRKKAKTNRGERCRGNRRSAKRAVNRFKSHRDVLIIYKRRTRQVHSRFSSVNDNYFPWFHFLTRNATQRLCCEYDILPPAIEVLRPESKHSCKWDTTKTKLIRGPPLHGRTLYTGPYAKYCAAKFGTGERGNTERRGRKGSL